MKRKVGMSAREMRRKLNMDTKDLFNMYDKFKGQVDGNLVKNIETEIKKHQKDFEHLTVGELTNKLKNNMTELDEKVMELKKEDKQSKGINKESLKRGSNGEMKENLKSTSYKDVEKKINLYPN